MAKKTRLYDRHVALGGRMVEYAGWLLPVQYPQGPNAEHLQVRRAAGLFDIDHMGQVVVSGPEALPYLQSVMTADVAGILVGAAGYSLLCYADGTVVDDTFIYRRPESYFIAINAANNEKDTQWLKYHSLGWDVSVKNVSDETFMLALQGPAAEAILNLLCEQDLSQLTYHRFFETRVAGIETLVGRTGYTGEDGFELFFPADAAETLWDALSQAGEPHGLWPIGLAARDSLRFEPCLPLYGQELSARLTPIEAGLAWAVAFDKGGFVGREALLKQRLEGPARRLVAFEMTERGVPRHDYPVLVDGEVCGWVTTGMYAPSLDQFLGMAYVSSEHSQVGAELGIQIRNTVRSARIVKKPFYLPTYRRRRRA
jgi:aminomethyltransferase